MFKPFFKRRTKERRNNHTLYDGPERRLIERRNDEDRRHRHPFHFRKKKHDRRSGEDRRATVPAN